MATCCFEQGQIVKIEGVEHLLLQRVGSTWQLQQSKTGLFINHLHSVLLRMFAESKLTFPSRIPEQQCFVANDDTSSKKFDMAKVRRSYVINVLEIPNSQKPMEEAIQIVWNRIKTPENPPAWTSVYQWRSRYIKANQDIRALLDNTFNKGNRGCRYTNEVVEICHRSIQTRYLSKERNGIQDTLEDALARVRAENKQRPPSDALRFPTRKLIRRLISELPAHSKCLAREGSDVARKSFRSVKGHIVTRKPFDRAEIDHTILDIFVVDDATNPADRLPLGRPYVTACIDCYTRCILGIYIGFTPPSYQSVAACLKHCFTPKVNLKQDYPEIVNEWSAFGVMEQLVVDGGREFYSVSLDRACHFFNIDWVPSPRRTPWFKPHIERFMRTLNDNTAHGIPGTTFSNIVEKGDYDPLKHAVISLKELKRNIYKWVVDVYHQQTHRSLGMSPAKMWASSVKLEDYRMPDELTRLDVALGRIYEGRRLSHKGVEFEGLLYNSDDLRNLRMKEGAKLFVDIRVDESNLGYINVTYPKTAREYSVPAIEFEYANGVSLWLHKVLKNWQRAKHEPNQTSEGWLEAKAAIQRNIAEAGQQKRLKPSKRRGRFDEALSDAALAAGKRGLSVVVPQQDSEEASQVADHTDSRTADSGQSTSQAIDYPVFQAIRRKEVSYEQSKDNH